MNESKILDLGCGLRKTKGAIGLDNVGLGGVDIVHDLTHFPYPFETKSIDKIYCKHVLEHFDSEMRNRILFEIQRTLKPKGLLEIRVPHAFCIAAKMDPTHKSFYCFHSIRYFTKDFKYSYYKNMPTSFILKKTWLNLGFSLENGKSFKKKIADFISRVFNKAFNFKGFAPDLFVKILPIFSVEIVWLLEKTADEYIVFDKNLNN